MLDEVKIEIQDGSRFFVGEVQINGKPGLEIRTDRQLILDVHAANVIIVRDDQP